MTPDEIRELRCECGQLVERHPGFGLETTGCCTRGFSAALASALTERLAQAWDEGHVTCCDDRCFSDGNPYRSHADSGRSAGALSGEQGSVRVVGRGEGSGARKGDELTGDERADLLASFRNGVGRKPSEGNPR